MVETVYVKDKSGGADLKAFASMINTLVDTTGGVTKELIRTAQSNPLIGMFVTLLLVDVAQKQGLLKANSAIIIKTVIAAEGGIIITSELLTALSDFIPSIGTKAVPNSLIVPTATTIVNSEEHVDPTSAAELGKK